jgi:hypothetical protein
VKLQANPPGPRPHDADTGWVYFIQRECDGLIQIVTSLEQLSSADGPLELLGVIQGGARLERELHKRFRRNRAHGEWFNASLALSKFIELYPVSQSRLASLDVNDPRRPVMLLDRSWPTSG